MMDAPDILPAFLASILRHDIQAFTRKVFHHINPGAEYIDNWHIGLIMETLQEVERGNIRRLIINMPPRSLKSICTSVAFPAWVLAHQPHKRIITTSYSLQLAKKHSMDCRGVIGSDWYQELFPETQLTREQNDKLKFQTSEFGFRLATSVGGTLTGEGGDILILDDPINAAQAQTPVLRSKVSEWYKQTLVSRLDNKRKGTIVLVMQRFHPEDLSGELLKTGHWQHLNLPLVATQKEHFVVSGQPVGRRVGDLLHAARDTPQQVAQLKAEIGSFAFEAQYQQNPITQNGEMIKREWFGVYQEVRDEGGGMKDEGSQSSPSNAEGVIIQSWDTAIKSSASSDYSVCITAHLHDGVSDILDVHRDRMEYPALKRRTQQLAERFKPDHILIEDKASGQQLIQDLRREYHLPIIPIMPKGDKFSRISAATGMLEAGKVRLPEHAHWLADFLNEALGYPNTTHDDQIDALAQYLNWLRARPKAGLSIRNL